MRKYLPFSRRQPSLDRFTVSKSVWTGLDRSHGKSLRRASGASLNTRSIRVVRGAYNIDLNKVDLSFTKLHRACLLNDEAQVRKHLQKVDNNSRDSSHRYPIHLATVNGNYTILKLLMDNGANPNVQDNEGNTPLIKSIECGHEHLVKFFLSNNADPNISDMDNNTALHWAITTESIIALDALLSSKRCDMSLRNNKDETCMHLAVRSPMINTTTFEAMVKSGSDLSAKDQLGLNVIDIAQACNNKIAIGAFNRCLQIDIKPLDEPTKTTEADTTSVAPINNEVDKDEDQSANNTRKLCDEYRQKYITKNRENLEYEKRVIQLVSQIERLRVDTSYLKEKYKKLETDNSSLRSENEKLHEQIRSLKRRDISIEQGYNIDMCVSGKIKSDDSDESVECKGHKEFLAARSLNQDRINKLKSSLTT